MEHLGDFEFVNAIACSLEAAQGYFDGHIEHIDEFPDQGGSMDSLPDDEVEPMSLEDKLDLLEGLERLPPQYLRGLCRIVNEIQDANGQQDINRLFAQKLRKIDSYIRRNTHIVFLAGQPGQEQEQY